MYDISEDDDLILSFRSVASLLFLTREGAYMVVKIVILMVRMKLAGLEGGVGSLIMDLEEPAESVLLRMNILGEPKHAKQRGTMAVEAFKNYIQVNLKFCYLDLSRRELFSNSCLFMRPIIFRF